MSSGGKGFQAAVSVSITYTPIRTIKVVQKRGSGDKDDCLTFMQREQVLLLSHFFFLCLQVWQESFLMQAVWVIVVVAMMSCVLKGKR